MALETPRLKLVKPDTSELADINVLNNNFDKVDAAPGVTVCTSATRPPAPYAGQHIFETDTGRAYIRRGTAWEQYFWQEAEAAFNGNHSNTNWGCDFDLVRTGAKTGVLSGSLYKRGTDWNVTASAALTNPAVAFNSITSLPAWAKITGLLAGMGSTYVVAPIAGRGINQSIHIYIGGSGALQFRGQTSFTWFGDAGGAAYATFSGVPVKIEGS